VGFRRRRLEKNAREETTEDHVKSEECWTHDAKEIKARRNAM